MEQNTISLEQALENLSIVARAFKGTFIEHESLQTSLKMIHSALFPAPSPEAVVKDE